MFSIDIDEKGSGLASKSQLKERRLTWLVWRLTWRTSKYISFIFHHIILCDFINNSFIFILIASLSNTIFYHITMYTQYKPNHTFNIMYTHIYWYVYGIVPHKIRDIMWLDKIIIIIISIISILWLLHQSIFLQVKWFKQFFQQ